jgi:hypothetical protein
MHGPLSIAKRLELAPAFWAAVHGEPLFRVLVLQINWQIFRETWRDEDRTA